MWSYVDMLNTVGELNSKWSNFVGTFHSLIYISSLNFQINPQKYIKTNLIKSTLQSIKIGPHKQWFQCTVLPLHSIKIKYYKWLINCSCMLSRETTLPTLSLPALELLSRDPSDRTESFRTRAGICLPRVNRLPTSRNITQT